MLTPNKPSFNRSKSTNTFGNKQPDQTKIKYFCSNICCVKIHNKVVIKDENPWGDNWHLMLQLFVAFIFFKFLSSKNKYFDLLLGAHSTQKLVQIQIHMLVCNYWGIKLLSWSDLLKKPKSLCKIYLAWNMQWKRLN